jgi:hypothetical protein
LKKSKGEQQVVLAFHSAFQALGFKNANKKIAMALKLMPQERGHELLFSLNKWINFFC